VGKRLIITNGDWTTRHEIGDAAIVIGRDPNCDLFFVNQKLSRRHARVEPGPDGVKLVDLGSRNGIWVNDQKLEEHLLQPGDAIRLGGLRISYQEDPPPPEPDATVVLSGSGAHDSLGPDETVGLGSASGQAGEMADSTVLLPGASADIDRTVLPQESAEGTETVMLEAGSQVEREATRIFTGEDATLAPLEPIAEEEEPLLVPEPEPFVAVAKRQLALTIQGGEALVGKVRRRIASLSWQATFILTLAGLGCLVYAVSALIWAGTSSTAIGILTGIPLIAAWVHAAVVLTRRLTVKPVTRLREGVEAVIRGEKKDLPSARAYPELAELTESVRHLMGKVRSSGTSPASESARTLPPPNRESPEGDSEERD
jgi:hypothetical protein